MPYIDKFMIIIYIHRVWEIEKNHTNTCVYLLAILFKTSWDCHFGLVNFQG